jgi:S-formylglutathione hydrolase
VLLFFIAIVLNMNSRVTPSANPPYKAEQLKPELLQAACDATGHPLIYRSHAGYDHSYFFIASFIEDHLRYHAKYLFATS